MKFDPTWRQIALLALLLAAPIIANLIAPGVIGAVSSVVSTVIGALFVNLRNPPGGPPSNGAGPDLKVIAGGLSAFLFAFFSVVGPAAALATLSGCELFQTGRAARPASYAAELAACEAKAPKGPEGWRVYLPCCEEAARRYGRDPRAC